MIWFWILVKKSNVRFQITVKKKLIRSWILLKNAPLSFQWDDPPSYKRVLISLT